MFDYSSLFQQIKKEIEKAQKILLIAHKKPDGDALGAACGLKLVLDQLGKKTVVACADSVPPYLQFIPGSEKLVKDFKIEDFDLFFVLDCGARYLTKFQESHPLLFKGEVKLINIDHHPSNDYFGTINIVDQQAATTSLIIFYLLQFLKISITPQIATCLLTGLYTDTGSFMHSNTNPEVYQVSAQLLEAGADFKIIIKNVFRNTPLSTLKLWGRVLNSLRITKKGVAVAVATQKDFKESGAGRDELSGVIDLLNSIPGAKFSLLLSEENGNQVKGSFRTREEGINLSRIAQLFGGGGHEKASGFTLPGRLEKEIRWKISKK